MRSRTRTLIVVLASAALLAAASGLARAHGSRPRGGTLERGLQIRVVQAINAMRQRHGLVALRVDGGLVAAAAEHSRAMAEKGYFAHAGRDGSSVEARLRRHYRVRSHGYWLVGEILAWGSPG